MNPLLSKQVLIVHNYLTTLEFNNINKKAKVLYFQPSTPSLIIQFNSNLKILMFRNTCVLNGITFVTRPLKNRLYINGLNILDNLEAKIIEQYFTSICPEISRFMQVFGKYKAKKEEK